ADGRKIPFTTKAGARYFLRTVSTDDLLKMERTQGVNLELLFRPGVRDENRQEALRGLARQEKKGEGPMLLAAIRDHDEQDASQDESVTFDLVRLLTSRPQKELAGARADLEKLATSARHPVTRELGYVALVAADGSAEKAWVLGLKSGSALRDMVGAAGMIRDP